jgi:hypothetical protein
MPSDAIPLFYFEISGRDAEGKISFGCTAADDTSALALARANGMTDAAIESVVLLSEVNNPDSCLHRIIANPLLGADWAPLAQAISVASETMRSRGFWRMDTLPLHMHPDFGAAPYVQGLTEWDGRQHLEVGGHATALDWTDKETVAALEMFGWSGSGDGSKSNLTLSLDASWTGMRVAECVLGLFTVVYGLSLSTPVCFGGSNTVREAVAKFLEVFSAPDVLISPAGLVTGNLTSQEPPPDEAQPDRSAPSALPQESAAGRAMRTAAETEGLSDDITARLIKDFLQSLGDFAPSTNDEGACRGRNGSFDTVTTRQLLALLHATAAYRPDFAQATEALAELDSDTQHVDRMVPVGLIMIATNPKNRIDNHSRCDDRCLLRDTATRLLIAACSDEVSVREQLRYDSCVHVRTAARQRDTEISGHPLERRAATDLCGRACDNGWQDAVTHLADAGLATPTLGTNVSADIRRVDDWSWATQPSPRSIFDYQPLDFDYLRGALPDQFALSHSGHGANSYSLNIRFIVGPLAIHAQTAWGGIYSGTPSESPEWKAIQDVVGFAATFFDPLWNPAKYANRRLLITFSDFRSGDQWTVTKLKRSVADSDSEAEEWTLTTEQTISLLRRVYRKSALAAHPRRR